MSTFKMCLSANSWSDMRMHSHSTAARRLRYDRVMNDSPATPVSRSIDNPRVCIVGGGNAAQTLAALLPSRGLETFVFAPYADEAERLQRGLAEQGHIVAEFAPHNSPAGTVRGTPTRVSRHAAEVIPDTDVLILPLPSFAYRSGLETVRPYLRSGCYICATPGQGASTGSRAKCLAIGATSCSRRSARV